MSLEFEKSKPSTTAVNKRKSPDSGPGQKKTKSLFSQRRQGEKDKKVEGDKDILSISVLSNIVEKVSCSKHFLFKK